MPQGNLNREFDQFARKAYHMSGDRLLAKLKKGESGGRHNAVSSAGARAEYQFMPQTRQAVIKATGGKVDPWRSEAEGKTAAQMHLLGKLGHRRGLGGYNPGDPNYPRYILNQDVGDAGKGGPTYSRKGEPSRSREVLSKRTIPGEDNSDLRKQVVLRWLQERERPGALADLASGLKEAQDVPAAKAYTRKTVTEQGAPTSSGGSGGGQSALSWAQSKIGFKEEGTNAGGVASYLNQRFGMTAQPWCAMFTSAATTKGGAPLSARTASVADVRAKAARGSGYKRGYVDPGTAKAGDLILFGNDHIGMVEEVRNGKVIFVAGNHSDGVQRDSVPVGKGDIVRPKYGARRR